MCRCPRRPGFDLLAEIRADGRLRTLPVIVITGMGDQEMKRQAIDNGADDLLAKPVSVADLMVRLKSALPYQAVSGRAACTERES